MPMSSVYFCCLVKMEGIRILAVIFLVATALDSLGYKRVRDDVKNHGNNPYEDWYVHPDLVDVAGLQQLLRQNDVLAWIDE